MRKCLSLTLVSLLADYTTVFMTEEEKEQLHKEFSELIEGHEELLRAIGRL